MGAFHYLRALFRRMSKLLDGHTTVTHGSFNGERGRDRERGVYVCMHVFTKVCEAPNLQALILDSYRSSSGTRPRYCST